MSWLMGFIALTRWIWAAILYGAVFLFAVRWAISYARKNSKVEFAAANDARYEGDRKVA